ncbi:hypothetical protein GCM10022631_42160 [Deinococcus rubellus]|uniref:ABC transporter permease n=1 Tax=Deinococcus rubellus TaxID=1889240 RepID=A0ABY5YML8_9DEIO|nr:hypothetical protein [Deinococcus rubellus]UWX65003.1 hypothetical protein N0D28_04915 [Deinococcus rubellus]
MPSLRPPRWRLFWSLVAFAGFIAAVFSLLWALGWLARTFGYQSNDANLPITLIISLAVFAAAGWLWPGAASQHLRQRLREWWRGER